MYSISPVFPLSLLNSFISITYAVPLKFRFSIPICSGAFVANRRNKSILWRVVTGISFHQKRTTSKYFLSKFRWFPVSLSLQFALNCKILQDLKSELNGIPVQPLERFLQGYKYNIRLVGDFIIMSIFFNYIKFTG